jgi:hypothetical protein
METPAGPSHIDVGPYCVALARNSPPEPFEHCFNSVPGQMPPISSPGPASDQRWNAADELSSTPVSTVSTNAPSFPSHRMLGTASVARLECNDPPALGQPGAFVPSS